MEASVKDSAPHMHRLCLLAPCPSNTSNAGQQLLPNLAFPDLCPPTRALRLAAAALLAMPCRSQRTTSLP